MSEEEIDQLRTAMKAELIETHISWVLLTEYEAIKIKKPVSFTFLDFSSLASRKHFCEEEFRLNRRLTDIYKQVSTIRKTGDTVLISDKGEIVDYAVVMERQPEKDRLDVRLINNETRENDMSKLAGVVSGFHHRAEIINEIDDTAFVEKRFRDVMAVADWVKEELGKPSFSILESAIEYHEKFLQLHSAILDERVEEGFKRDLHGDLHTQNIFIGDEVVVFDCIEFDKRYRQIDVISEIAFLIMDLQFYNRNDLAASFLSSYRKKMNILQTGEEEKLFRYYLAYRANVKVKVNGLRAMNTLGPLKGQLAENVSRYLQLLSAYISV